MRRIVAAVVAVGLVIGLRATVTRDTGFPISLLQQGVTALDVKGAHVFMVRQGSVVTAFATDAQFERDTLVWCPVESVFVSPQRFELYTIDGAYIDGPGLRDMTQYPVKVDGDLQVRVNVARPVRARARSNGEVSGEIGQLYKNARAGRAVRFCQNPVR